MTYSIVACRAIVTDCAENTFPLLLMGRCLVTSDFCDSTVLALKEYATILLIYSEALKLWCIKRVCSNSVSRDVRWSKCYGWKMRKLLLLTSEKTDTSAADSIECQKSQHSDLNFTSIYESVWGDCLSSWTVSLRQLIYVRQLISHVFCSLLLLESRETEITY